MSSRLRVRQTWPHRPWRRITYWWSRLRGIRLQKSQVVRFVTIGDKRYKRIILRDSHLADRIRRRLEQFGETDYFPPLIAAYEHEVWVGFVAGEPLGPTDDAQLAALADFYAHVYAREPRLVDLSETVFPYRLSHDLAFLRDVGVLSVKAHEEIQESLPHFAPKRVWLGWDYTDPVRKNFVVRRGSGVICAIDVEALEDDQLLGFGVAKTFVRWLEPQREAFLDRMRRGDAPDWLEHFSYSELSFLAAYMRMGFLEQKWSYVDSSVFDRFQHY